MKWKYTQDGIEKRNAKRLDSLDAKLKPGFAQERRDLDAYFDHHDGKPAPAGWADVQPREVRVPAREHEPIDPKNPRKRLTRLQQLERLSESGDTTTLAYNPGFAAAFKEAAESKHHPRQLPKEIWREARGSFVAEIRRLREEGHDIPNIIGQPVHHLVFPKRQYRQHITNPEMLAHCQNEDAHEQNHQTFGADGDRYKAELGWTNLVGSVAQQVMRFRAFLNPNDRVPPEPLYESDGRPKLNPKTGEPFVDPLANVSDVIHRAEAEYGRQHGYAERHFERKVALDTETTGLSHAHGDKIVEIAIVELLDNVASGRKFHSFINPERHIPEGVVKIHGIDDEKVAGMPTFTEKAEEIRNYIGQSPIIIHNAPFDMGFVNAEMKDAGLLPIDADQVIDTLALARHRHPGEKNNLDALCERYDVYNRRDQAGGHGALTDAEVLADLYGKFELGEPAHGERSHEKDYNKNSPHHEVIEQENADDETKAELARQLQAAKQGDPGAQYEVGMMYAWGRGVKQDLELGAHWTRKAAEQGKRQAQRSLAVMYAQGRGVEQDFVESARWTRRAAEQGDAAAQFSLGKKYQHGRGVKQDDEKAADWYLKAAEQDHAEAKLALDDMYYHGRKDEKKGRTEL